MSGNADVDDQEIERLKALAAELRAEAAQLEAEKAKELADAAERAFRQFDTNLDGEVSLAELKSGLEKKLKTELSESRVKSLMDEFDKTGTGTLTADEFVTVDKFRNRLESLAREEQRRAQEAAQEQKKAKEVAALLEAQRNLINDSPATPTERALSILPYLFPLIDGLQFGRFLLEGQDNPAIALLAILYGIYRSVPFSGFIVFLGLSFFSNNPTINRLIRFNMQQAIYLDIALFFPGLIAAIYSVVGGGIPPELTVIGNDVMFVTLLATLGYASVSSLLGITPDKIPLISDSVSQRMPTIDMFDDQGRFVPRELREKDKKKKDEDKKDS
jgi:hypothetical protein